MSVRNLSKFCRRHECVVSLLRGELPNQRAAASACFLLQHRSFAHSSRMNHGRFLSIEGVQGPIPKPLSLTEAKKLLDSAANHVSGGSSQQGVQGCHIHTSRPDSNSSSPANREWDFEDSASPQGVQGCADGRSDCGHFTTWLDNCRRYGLANCDQQLQGIQSGRLTLAEVLSEQQRMIQEIAENHRRRAQDMPDRPDESMQGAQGKLGLPEVAAPCPQGVQGDDCVRFKLWLENCHRFGLHDCMQQLQGLQTGRLTLAQIFNQQDETIRQVVQKYKKGSGSPQQTRSYSTGPRDTTTTADSPSPRPNSAQVGDGETGTPPPVQLTQRERLKRAVKEYGATVIVFHITISLASLGGFYLAVSSGIDMVGILKSVGVGEAILQSKLATGTGTFVVAYAVHKVFAPVRIGITLTSTPFIVRYLRSKGILKPPKVKKVD